MRISAADARQYWADPTQQLMGTTPDILPENDAFVYYASVDLCLMFHTAFWDGFWMVHAGVKPEGWGALDGQGLGLLREFWTDIEPRGIVAWIERKNRLMNAFARRAGFRDIGASEHHGLIIKEWRPEWAE